MWGSLKNDTIPLPTRGIITTNQWSTEGRRSTAVAEGFSSTATASAAEGLNGQRPKFRPKAKIFQKLGQKSWKVGLKIDQKVYDQMYQITNHSQLENPPES